MTRTPSTARILIAFNLITLTHLAAMEPTALKPFLITENECRLTQVAPTPERSLAFSAWKGTPEAWRTAATARLTELLGIRPVIPGAVRELRRMDVEGCTIIALIMSGADGLDLPAYLLEPTTLRWSDRAVLAIHGHGEVEPCIGLRDDYHHRFALALAQAGHRVLCPELRGFGLLKEPAKQRPGARLSYWSWGKAMQFSLASDSIQHGRPLIGLTVEDLQRWEAWLTTRGVARVDTAGISYGGDLALLYPVFSTRVDRIFASGTLGSFTAIFDQANNAPAHIIPSVLRWLDRADIAGLNAPHPIAIHFGERDQPGPGNNSASYNQTVPQSLAELRTIYQAFGKPEAIELIVSPGRGHEMDVDALKRFLER